MITIVGAGRIGGALSTAAAERHLPTTVVRRDAGWDTLPDTTGPILVTVRNDDLDTVVAGIPQARRDDLVFIQNGMLRAWQARVGLSHATRGLLFFAVPTAGAAIEIGGTSPFCGAHATAMVDFMTAVGVPAEVLDAAAFARVELEKLVWNAAFGLLCERFEASVGTVVDAHADTTNALLGELLAVGARELELDLDPPARDRMIERLITYSRSIAGYRGAVKEWPWRNGWFVEAAAGTGIATPCHDALLAATGHR